MKTLVLWPPEHREELDRLVAMKLSFADIADELNTKYGTHYTRSAIAGRCKRSGLKLESRKTRKSRLRVIKWDALYEIDGRLFSLDDYIVHHTRDHQRSVTEIVALVRSNWPISVTGHVVGASPIGKRLALLKVKKVRRHTVGSNRVGAFGRGPVQFEVSPVHIRMAGIRESDVTDMGTNERNSCKWPVNDDATALQMCGKLVSVGSYCRYHGALAYTQAPTPKRTRMLELTRIDTTLSCE